MLKPKLIAFICIFLPIFFDTSYPMCIPDSEGLSEQLFGRPQKQPERTAGPVTITPGQYCKKNMNSESAIWATWSTGRAPCSRPVGCREAGEWEIRIVPGLPPDGMLCALAFNGEVEAIQYACKNGECLRSVPE